MESSAVHRLALADAVCATGLLITGALLTDYHQVLLQATLVSNIHIALAALTAILTIGLAIWLTVSKAGRGPIALAWVACAGLLADAALANSSLLAAAPRGAGAFHALLAQFFFGAIVALAACTSESWTAGPELVHDQGWPSLRFLGTAMLVLVLSQVSLGAAFRHKASGLMPHLVGAMIVALWILIVCMFVMQQFPEHRSLRPAANFLLSVTLAQVFLGIAALTMRMMNSETSPALLVSTAGHVTTGALTLAATVILTMQIRRNVQPKLEEIEAAEEPADA
jgi:heme A synthase